MKTSNYLSIYSMTATTTTLMTTLEWDEMLLCCSGGKWCGDKKNKEDDNLWVQANHALSLVCFLKLQVIGNNSARILWWLCFLLFLWLFINFHSHSGKQDDKKIQERRIFLNIKNSLIQFQWKWNTTSIRNSNYCRSARVSLHTQQMNALSEKVYHKYTLPQQVVGPFETIFHKKFLCKFQSTQIPAKKEESLKKPQKYN